MEELSITRALAEIQLLDKRIFKLINFNSEKYVCVKSDKSTVDFEKAGKSINSSYQSIIDLINRRHKLKSAVILKNAQTMIQLTNEKLSIAELIERKQMVEQYRNLLDYMKQNKEDALNQVRSQNEKVESELLRIIEASFGKNSSNTKSSSASEIETISTTYRKKNYSELFDPLDINAKIKTIDSLIDEYDRESNYLLAEVNAITKILV